MLQVTEQRRRERNCYSRLPSCQQQLGCWAELLEIVYDQPTLGLMKYIHQCQKLSDPGDKTRSALKLHNVTR